MRNYRQRAVTIVVMSDAKNHIENAADSREEFVRNLRHRARQATEASVHHAAMSQQYLELSQKFSQLAQQAGSARLEDLQTGLDQIEDEIAAAPSTSVDSSVAAPIAETASPAFAQTLPGSPNPSSSVESSSSAEAIE